MTNTTLDLTDPVTHTVCTGHGLILAAGVRLDLNGTTLSGSNSGTGLWLSNGGTVQGGTVRAFAMGIRVGPGAVDSSAASGTTIQNNAGDGVLVDVADSRSRVVLSGVTIVGNGGDGIHVRGAPGLSNLDDVSQRLESPDYGFSVSRSVVSNNAGHGIHLGDSSQPGDVAAMIGGYQSGNQIVGNGGAGILMEQAKILPGADCGASAGQPGCTGATIAAT